MTKKKLISTKMKVFMLSLLLGSVIAFSFAGVVLYNSGFSFANYFNVAEWQLGLLSHSDYNYSFSSDEKYSINQDLNGIEELNVDFNGYTVYFENYEGPNLALETSNRFLDLDENSTDSPFEISYEGNKLTVKPNKSILSNVNENYLFIIKIPYSYNKNLNINSVCGSIKLDSSQLINLNINSINCDVMLSNLNCENATINITNGNIATNAFVSKVFNASTINGNIHSTPISGEIKLSTISGDIWALLTNSVTKLDASTTSGNIHFNLPVESNFTFNYSTINGEFYRDLNNVTSTIKEPSKSPEGNINFSIGTGENKIDVKTINGDLTLSN